MVTASSTSTSARTSDLDRDRSSTVRSASIRWEQPCTALAAPSPIPPSAAGSTATSPCRAGRCASPTLPPLPGWLAPPGGGGFLHHVPPGGGGGASPPFLLFGRPFPSRQQRGGAGPLLPKWPRPGAGERSRSPPHLRPADAALPQPRGRQLRGGEPG